MPKHHRYLLGLIMLASLVTIVFQCFWLIGNYQHEKESFISHAERLLFECMQEERELQFRKAYPEAAFPIRAMDTTLLHDSLPFRWVPNKLLQVDFQRLKKRYQEKLGHDLSENFFLDTFTVTQHTLPKNISSPTVPTLTPVATAVPIRPVRLYSFARPADEGHFREEMLTPPPFRRHRFAGPPRMPNAKIMAGYPIEATTLMFNPSSDLFLSLYLKPPVWWIFKKLAWVLLSSLLLTGLTVGCLVYLLYTIFKQKKLADIKNDFVNNMTHELKTPLATVLAATESLQLLQLNGDVQKANLYLQMTHRAATHLTGLIDQLLHLAVGEKTGMRLQTEDIDTSRLLKQLVETYQLISQQPIRTRIDENIPFVKADRMHLTNAINNLLDNALKYSTDPIIISVISRISDKQWVLRVADNGIGIAASEINHIFQPFYRIPTGNIHRVKGFGLGLHYVKQVIEQHKGHIDVESTPGIGTTFTIYLPLTI